MKGQRIAEGGGVAALALLRLTHAAADAFPPLKSATGGVLHIVETVEKFKSNKKEWIGFSKYVQDALGCVIEALSGMSQPPANLQKHIENLKDTLDRIDCGVRDLQSQSASKRVMTFMKDPGLINEFKQQLMEALSLFQLSSALITSLGIGHVFKISNINQHLQLVMNKLTDKIDHRLILMQLPYAEGASWDPHQACLENTRVELLEHILSWIHTTTSSTRIFWLNDVAGAGKSALAHTVAQKCYKEGQLASSFFFDREVSGRNGPKKLFSTIARDLAKFDEELGRQISLAIEDDPSLPTAPISRQFHKLILGPSKQYAGNKPIIIVIDALDEGYDALDEAYDNPLLKILCDEAVKLPMTFRIFLTSRSESEIQRYLSQKLHVQCQSINIHGQANQRDTVSYSQFRLAEIAKHRHLNPSWPGQGLFDQFTRKADGLFLWVSTVSDYLQRSTNPDKQLCRLLSGSQLHMTPEAKMDELYSRILTSCNWKDEDFVEGYTLLVGAIIAVQTPVSVSVLENWHPTLRVRDTLGQIGSLITGWNNQSEPIQIIHLSFRDFLTTRASLSVDSMKFWISEEEQNNRLTLLCLVTMNKNLKPGMPGTGYLAELDDNTLDIPDSTKEPISDALWYACRFWISHIIAVITPGTELVSALQEFLSVHLVTWIEIVTSKGNFQGLTDVRTWLLNLKSLPEQEDLKKLLTTPFLAKRLAKLSLLLSKMGQQAKALLAIQESVELYRLLATDLPVEFNSNLAMSLHNLSIRLSELGHRDEALLAIKEAVKLYRPLAIKCPTEFNSELASCLNSLSIRLSQLGQPIEALQVAQESVELYRSLVIGHPAEFNSELARSLSNLSIWLSKLDRQNEALSAIEEAVKLYRPLAMKCPAEFNSELARCLNSLSTRYSKSRHQDKALQAIQESVNLYRPLAINHPTVFNSKLAMSLFTLSVRISESGDSGDQDEALSTIEEAIKLYRPLAKDYPEVYNSNLATCLNSQCIFLSELGDSVQALQVIQESVELLRFLVMGHPAVFKSELARSLHNLVIELSKLDYQDEALPAIEEAIKSYRFLAADPPAESYSDLVTCFTYLSKLGHSAEALQVRKEAIELCQQLAAENATKFKPLLELTIEKLSNTTSKSITTAMDPSESS